MDLVVDILGGRWMLEHGTKDGRSAAQNAFVHLK